MEVVVQMEIVQMEIVSDGNDGSSETEQPEVESETGVTEREQSQNL